jgi:hypothetical protein
MSEDVRGIVGGALFGAIGGLKLFTYPMVPILPTGNIAGDLALDFAAKVMGTIILGVVGGLAGLFSKDLYKWLKSKFSKNGKVS